MCGIIGILSANDVAPRLIEGLRRLEYRGYDSAGIATLAGGQIKRCRAEGKIVNLEERLKKEPLKGAIGIGHTRWATHGGPSERNAHPHATDRVAVVHNGIIENYAALKEEMESLQCRFETDTDTEVVAHLVTHNLKQGMKPQEAALAAFKRLEGAYALALIFAGEDDLMIGVRQGTPLAVGYGEGEMFMASDSYALAPMTRKISFLEDGDRVVVSRTGVTIYSGDGKTVERPVRITAQSGATAGKGDYPHFMLKEIHEQPAVIADTLNSFINPATGAVNPPAAIIAVLEKTPRLTMVACGTAHYACHVAKYWFEKYARLPVDIDIASEFRYRHAPLTPGGTALFVSQSGETLDTLEALRYCRREKQTIMALVNTIESTIERESDLVLHTLAGPEIGVASTKAFTTQLASLACLALALGIRRGTVSGEDAARMSKALRRLPVLVADVLKDVQPQIRAVAEEVAPARDVIYLGRGALYPLALEGALKLKEVSYIHAEGFAAGELKHGPIAMIDEKVPVVVMASGADPLLEKISSNVQEVMARGGRILLVTDEAGAAHFADRTAWQIVTGAADPFIQPILYAVPVQLLAYYVALERGTDVDQPRNLAKSVTVE